MKDRRRVGPVRIPLVLVLALGATVWVTFGTGFLQGVPVPTTGRAAGVQGTTQWDEGGTLDEVRVEVDFRTDALAPRVRIRHHLTPEGGVDSLRLFSLQLGMERIQDLEAFVGGQPVPLVLSQAVRGRLDGVVGLDPGQPGPATVELRYTVGDALLESGDGDYYRLPLILPRWRPSGSASDFFVASAMIPAGVTVSETFPTVRPEIVGPGEDQRVSLSLQTVPSILRYRLDAGTGRFFTVARSVDLGVGLVLIILGALAIRVLRRDLRAQSGGRP